jgi:hypothetical protein
MASVRSIWPTDLVALVAYDGKVYPNEAVTRERIGKEASPHPLETAIEQWFSFATGRHTWISVKGATLRGLVSARKRGSNTAWEIDCLIHTEEEPDVLLNLLDQVTEDAGRAGAEKVFLRTEADSDVLRDAAAAGFAFYMREHLFVAEGPREVDPPSFDEGVVFRRWSKADAYDTFRLYNRATPEPVRHTEAATFREWTASRERISPNRGTRQWVLQDTNGIAGWLRAGADGEVGRFDMMVDVAATGLLDQLIDAALARLSEQSLLLTLVPDFAVGVVDRLQQRGFEERGEFVVLAKRTVRPIEVAETAAAAAPVQIFPA